MDTGAHVYPQGLVFTETFLTGSLEAGSNGGWLSDWIQVSQKGAFQKVGG